MPDSITPPPELVEQWRKQPEYTDGNKLVTMVTMTTDRLMQLCEKAAQHGADQEREAWCKWTAIVGGAKALRAARRPKLPSLKDQALAALREACEMANDRPPEGISNDQIDIIRCALEALDD